MKNRFFLSCFLATLTSLVILTFASPTVSATALQQEEAGPARTAYEAKLNEWKQMLKDLQQLRSEFNDAKPSQIPAAGNNGMRSLLYGTSCSRNYVLLHWLLMWKILKHATERWYGC